jgi:2-polyprenyl-3-methyl-5-hydroxy-6-metoxy-1,4-benzoquinol methylase
MKTYYKERAPIYDKVYNYPERQNDLRFLEDYVRQQITGFDVLEIAAGTGYWTQFISQKAKSVLATDVTQEVLERLKDRELSSTVSTKVIDAYSLKDIPQQFDGAFAGLWLSHVPKQKLKEFVLGLHHHLSLGARVTFIDNSTVQCRRLPITDKDKFCNTYQDRLLDNGTTYKVLKNFPTREELLELVYAISSDEEHIELDNFWLFTYKVI